MAIGVSVTTTSAMAMIGSFAVRDIIVDVLCGTIGTCKDENPVVLPKVGIYNTFSTRIANEQGKMISSSSFFITFFS